MTQAQLDRAVSKATGESFEVIARRGFSLVDEDSPDDDQERFIDWDQHDAKQRVALFRDRQHGNLV